MQKLSAYNLAQNNNCGLITCSICGRSYRITEFGTDADCQSNSPSASVPNFCPYCASPFERPLTRVRKQEIEDYILDTIRIGMKSDTVLDPETVIDFLCNISDGGFELYDPKFENYFNSGITYGADNLELLHVTKHEIDLTVQRGGVIFQDVLKDWSIEPDATIHVWRFSESESDVMTSEFSLFMLGLLAKIKAGTIWKSSLFILSCLSDHQVYSYKNNLRELIHIAISDYHPKNMEQFKKLLASWGVDIFIKNNRVYATDLDIKEAGNPKCTFNLTRLDGRFALKSLQTAFETGTTESEKPMTFEQRRDVYIQRLKKAYSAWVEQAKASKGVAYNAFPKFVAPKCDDDLLEDPAVRDELLARRGYAKEIRNRYASAVPDYGEDNVRAAGQAGTHSVQQPVIESVRTREQSDKNAEH